VTVRRTLGLAIGLLCLLGTVEAGVWLAQERSRADTERACYELGVPKDAEILSRIYQARDRWLHHGFVAFLRFRLPSDRRPPADILATYAAGFGGVKIKTNENLYEDYRVRFQYFPAGRYFEAYWNCP
jgi:hypothetical protein